MPKQVATRRTPRERLSPAEREQRIVEGAIAYFSEAGFAGQTRELSRRLGVTQPLLYRYFPSKQALIERVYRTVFEGRWNPQWLDLLRDRSRPLRERLIEFYRQYSEATYRPEWIRIYMHAGLADPALNRRYISLIRRELMPVYCRELRDYCRVRDDKAPVTGEEMEFAWNLHGGLFYYAMRRDVYQIRMEVDFMDKAAYAIDTFLAGAKITYPRLLAARVPVARPGQPAKRTSRA
ncbi:MAG: TetR/AcrR family transcriptional regulator [Burkholderiales bacterium]|nr:TetR/AcrR family transcriptional regulator [Burkholderiales bacterium]